MRIVGLQIIVKNVKGIWNYNTCNGVEGRALHDVCNIHMQDTASGVSKACFVESNAEGRSLLKLRMLEFS